MTEPVHAPPAANSRPKIIIAVGLAAALGYVLLSSDEKPKATAGPAATSNAKPRGRQPSPSIANPIANRPTQAIARVPLAEVLRYSPFEINGRIDPQSAPPQSVATQNGHDSQQSPMPEVKPPHPAIAALSGIEADIILESSRGRSARIGPRIIHEGTVVARNAKVQTIDDRGAVVELQFLPKPVRAKLPRRARH